MEVHKKEWELSGGKLSSRYRPTAPVKPNEDDIKRLCERDVINQESIMRYMYRSMIYGGARDSEINSLFVERMKEQQRQYKEALVNYELELTKFENERATYQNTLPEMIKASYQEYLNTILGEKSVKPRKNDKLLRAYLHGLVTGDGENVNRPSDEEWSDLRQNIIREDNFICCICRKSISQSELHIHHIIPLAMRGTNNGNNLVTLCYTCHNKQHEGFNVTRFRPIRRVRHGGEFVAVDIETTGLSNNDHIIEIAAVRFNAGKAVATFESLVNPGAWIPENIVQLTGITNMMLASAPTMNTVFPRFVDFISRHKLVMHNSSFDMRFLQRYAAIFGRNISNEVVDTLALARRKLPHLKNRQLSTLVQHFDIDYGQRHRARDDCIATGLVYINCLRLRAQ